MKKTEIINMIKDIYKELGEMKQGIEIIKKENNINECLNSRPGPTSSGIEKGEIVTGRCGKTPKCGNCGMCSAPTKFSTEEDIKNGYSIFDREELEKNAKSCGMTPLKYVHYLESNGLAYNARVG